MYYTLYVGYNIINMYNNILLLYILLFTYNMYKNLLYLCNVETIIM